MNNKNDEKLQKVYDSHFEAGLTLDYIYSQFPKASLSEKLSRRLKRKNKHK
jgi:hypothetical protein